MLKQKLKKVFCSFLIVGLMSVGITSASNIDDSNIFDGKVKDIVGSVVINKNSKNVIIDDFYTMTVNNTNLMGVYYPNNTIASLNGNIVVEARMKFSSVTGVVHPIAIYGKDFTGSNVQNYGYSYMLYVENGSFKASNPTSGQKWKGSNVNTLGEAKADTFYKVKVIFNIDGNSETTDTYYYSISDDTGVLYTNYDTSGYNIGISDGGNTYNFYDMTAITGMVFGASKTADMTVTYDYVKACEAVPVFVNSSLEDGAVDVEGGSTVTLDFNSVMNADTFSNIKLLDADGKEIKGLECLVAEDKMSCTLKLPELGSMEDYKIVVSGVMSEDMTYAENITINFTSIKSNIILYKDFSTMSKADFNNDQDVAAKHISYDLEDGRVVFARARTDGLTAAVRYPKNGSLSIKDNVEIEAKIKFNSTAIEGAESLYQSVVPITIMDKNVVNNENYAYPFMLYMRGGKLYAAMPKEGSSSANGQEICEIEEDKYYTFKIILNIDGDADTVDKYYYTVSDGENEYSNPEGYNVGASASDSKFNLYNLTSITDVYFGTNKVTSSKMCIDYVKITQLQNPSVDSSLQDGTDDVELDEEITLTFSEPVQESSFEKIKLYCGDVEVTGISIISNDMLDKCTIKVDGGLIYNRAYKLTIPAMITQSKLVVSAQEISFKTKEKPLAVSISNVTVNDGGVIDMSPGAVVDVKANFTNTTDSEQSGCLIVGVYNSDNKLQKILFDKRTLVANSVNEEFKITATMPEDIGSDGYIRIFGWDSLEGMNAGIDMIVFSSNNV